jgi:Protein of unknown function (DUF4231)
MIVEEDCSVLSQRLAASCIIVAPSRRAWPRRLLPNGDRGDLRWECVVTDTDQDLRRFWGKWRVGRQLDRLDQWPSDLKELRKVAENSTIYRANWSIEWHTLAYRQAVRWYNSLKVIQIIAAAAIPILTGIAGGAQWSKFLIAALGGLIVILEGIQQLKKYGQNAVLWGQGKEALKREYYLYRAKAGVYSGTGDQPDKVFADRIEQIIGNEVGKWAERSPEQGNGISHGSGKKKAR